ncbi:MAG: ParB N-terminal domain-containing protein [Acidobacteriota bacterium]|nr:ParB N-terminal domain-containing protein [Acidobacteriota bacterium]
MKYQFHPVAEVFPLMNDDELEQLAEDIEMFGQREPILIFENQIVDGRNRALACELRGITPIVVEYAGSAEELVSLAVSLNLRRRHLDESQRAMVAAKLANMRQGERTDISQICERLSQSDAAELLNVSPRSVFAANSVIKNGVMELVEKVEEGELSVSAASKIAEMPKGKQVRMLKRYREEGKPLVSKLIEKKAKEINRETKAVCLCCNPELEFNEQNLLVHLTKLLDRAPARMERYLIDILDELQEEIGDGVATQNRNARILVENAIRDGFRTREQIKKYTGLDNLTLSAALAVMLEYKRILPKIQGGKTEAARGSRKEFFVMSDENLPEEKSDALVQDKITETVSTTQHKAAALIEKALRSGFQTRDEIKMHSGLDTVTLSAVLSTMLKDKIISSVIESSRGFRTERFVMNETLRTESGREEKFDQFENELAEIPVMETNTVH